MQKDIIERLLEFNAGRIPAMLALKYKAMRAGAYPFLRGSCHVFYEDWPAGSTLDSAPLSWVCGDLHLENFGSYQGVDGKVYFDINDFDEGTLAPCAWDGARFLTSLILAGNSQRLPNENIIALCAHFLDTYFATLAAGQVHSLEHDNASGLVKKLLHDLKTRKRDEFLDARCKKTKTGRKFKPDYANFLPPGPGEEQMVTKLIKTLAIQENKPEPYKVEDIAFRIAGTGSLGTLRYVALINGKGAPEKDFILDLKEARPSALAPTLQTPQPEWGDQAGRAVAIQKRLQGMPPALLTSVVVDGSAFIAREYHPLQDRIDLQDWSEKIPLALDMCGSMAQILAWGELRSAGMQGAAETQELMAYGRQAGMKIELLNFARICAEKTHKDFERFAEAYDDGLFMQPGVMDRHGKD